MDCRPANKLAALTLAVGLIAAGVSGAALGQAYPYLEKDCRALADDLATAGPLPKPYRTEVQWFRDGDLGIKGNQCRITATGVAAEDKGAKVRPGIDDIASRVTRVLKSHGFTGDRLLKRYKRHGDSYRAFALRKDRATCWANLESEGALVMSRALNTPAPKAPAEKPVPVWRLNVDCFLG
jgi:hypothetical protein